MTAVEATSAAASGRGMRADWRRWALLPGLALWVALLRLPTLHLVFADFDEGFFLLVGQAWNQGHLPYDAIWDVKPPGLFALFALAQRLFGPGLLASRLLAYVAVLASSLLLHRFARRHLARRIDGGETPGSDRLPLAVAMLYPAYSMAMYGAWGRSELLLAPLVIAGFDLVLTWRRGRRDEAKKPSVAPMALAGLLFGAAVMIKQTALFEGMLAAAMVTTAGRLGPGAIRRAIAPAAVFAGAAILPTLGFTGYFAGHGVEYRLFLAPFTGAARRLGGDGLTFVEGLENLLPMSAPVAPLAIMALLVLAAERRRIARFCRDGGAVWFVHGWLATALLAVIAMRAMYPGYLLPLVPPLLLACALALRSLDDRLRASGIGLRRATAPAMALALALYPYGWVHWSGGEGVWETHLPTLAAERLHRHGLTPSGSLYVANGDPAIYLLAGVLPPTRYAFPQHLICDFGFPEASQVGEIERILADTPDFIAISFTQSLKCQRPDRLAPMRGALAGYRLLEVVTADRQTLDLYRRLDPDHPGNP